jgi:hypothetical protein
MVRAYRRHQFRLHGRQCVIGEISMKPTQTNILTHLSTKSSKLRPFGNHTTGVCELTLL